MIDFKVEEFIRNTKARTSQESAINFCPSYLFDITSYLLTNTHFETGVALKLPSFI